MSAHIYYVPGILDIRLYKGSAYTLLDITESCQRLSSQLKPGKVSLNVQLPISAYLSLGALLSVYQRPSFSHWH